MIIVSHGSRGVRVPGPPGVRVPGDAREWESGCRMPGSQSVGILNIEIKNRSFS